MVTESGKSHRVFEARLRSGWEDDYSGAIADMKRHYPKPQRLVDCLRARKPLSDNDFELLAQFIEDTFRPAGKPTNKWVHEAVNLLGSLVDIYKASSGKKRIRDDKLKKLIDEACVSVEMHSGSTIDRDAVEKLYRR